MLINILKKIRNKVVPIINYKFSIEAFDFFLLNPITMSFDINSLDTENYKYIYLKMFTECISQMNLMNQRLITDYFSTFELNDNSRSDFLNITLTEYINNLTDRQRKDLSASGIVSSYFLCTVTDNYNWGFNTQSLCIGNIKVFIANKDLDIKINWNKISTISSLVPLMLIVNTYEYFNNASEC